ncbi:MAG: SusD family outer membrane lipoprotein NanU [Sphingobacteriales bacterium]
MKKYIIILLSGLGVLTLAPSCRNDLNLNPVSQIGNSSFFKTATQFDSYMAGIHSVFRAQTESFQRLGEMRADAFGTDAGSSSAFTGEATQGEENLWHNTLTLSYAGVNSYGTPPTQSGNNFYFNIGQINAMIANLNTTTVVTPANKSYYLGICYGMRAFYYFQIYRSWGNAIITTAPIVININNLNQTQSPAASVMALIKSDIDQSVASFGTDYSFRNLKGYWSLSATLMLKAEVYLWTSSHNNSTADATIALTALNTIQTNVPSLQLLPSYSNVFATTNRGNNEIIFAIHNTLNEYAMTWVQSSFVPQNNLIVAYYDSTQNRQFNATTDNWGGLLRAPVKIATFRRFDPLDTRRLATIQPCYSKNAATGLYTMAGCFADKYAGEQNAGVRSITNDFPIYRYADLLLLKATAEVYLGQSPANEINMVRARAFGANYNAATMSYPNQAIDSDPREAILQERFFEFIFEGKRWYDLRSMGDSYVYEHTTLTAANSYALLWPIDQTTLINDPLLKQTPGYASF